jgi:hypothetical protein
MISDEQILGWIKVHVDQDLTTPEQDERILARFQQNLHRQFADKSISPAAMPNVETSENSEDAKESVADTFPLRGVPPSPWELQEEVELETEIDRIRNSDFDE